MFYNNSLSLFQNLEFLLGGESPVGQSPFSYEDIENKLSELFHSGAIFDDVVNWISVRAFLVEQF